MRDMRLAEVAPFALLLTIVLWIGVAPAPLMEKVNGAVMAITREAHGR